MYIVGLLGDVLGIYHPPTDLSSLAIYYYAVDTGLFNHGVQVVNIMPASFPCNLGNNYIIMVLA